jgi:Xaa-Pro aminopeptidase
VGISNLRRLQERLCIMGYQGLMVPSADEYLSEFAQPFARRLGWVTGFRGSTGLAIVLHDRAALFLDGRYRLQGVRDTEGSSLEVLDGSEASRQAWLIRHMRSKQCLGLDTRLHSYPEVESVMSFAARQGIRIVDVKRNPIDELWGVDQPPEPESTVFDYPPHYAGLTSTAKCAQLRAWLSSTGADCQLVADPEDVAWLLNVRTHDSHYTSPDAWHIVPIPLSRVLIGATGKVLWFIESFRLDAALLSRLAGEIEVLEPTRFESCLEERARGKLVCANLRRTPHRFASLVARVGTLRDDKMLAHWRWKKHPNEIDRAREGHFLDGQAVIRFLAWVQRTVGDGIVTELDASRKLIEFRNELSEYKGMSMPLMSASGPSGSMAHYVPSEQSNRRLNDHPIYWMDSGAQYLGCSTDNTVCIAVGRPEARHIHAHTLVVKGYIALATAKFPAGISSTQVDSFARQYLWQEGLDYAHGTGHGVGNFMNIHEGPAIRKDSNFPTVAALESGMIVANEPAYYSDGDFGIRVESHMVTVQSKYEGFLEFETVSRLPIDSRLMDESLLTSKERKWLAEYHVWIANGYKGCFDEATEGWLQKIVDSYISMNR